MRNRIISGLSQATVVVEAGIGSGSLITAKDAILQGRDVFAIPANVGSKGADGINGLLRDGAKMALSTDDVLAPYEYTYAETLKLEAFAQSKNLQSVDLSHLAALGVIELSKDTAGEIKLNPGAVSGEKKEKKEKKPASPRTASQKKEKNAEPQLEAKREEPSLPTPTPRAAIPEVTLATLTPVQKAILETIPDDGTLSTDAIFALEHSHAEVMAALTMLEIMGLIQKLPGSLYKKA
jgi:predicted Rossmann fold nucleotide-binding protein DprA/Smf involved in DNA uptake